jgi:ABC-2 type transport system ATP-binding protein
MTAAIIEARDLAKRFDGFTAVDHISFAVPEGVIFGFVGPNGAGKTTTIKMLTTVLSPSEGRLRVAGHDPVKEPLLVRRAFGIVFQDPARFAQFYDKLKNDPGWTVHTLPCTTFIP